MICHKSSDSSPCVRSRAGFTLPEVLVASFILAIVVTLVMTMVVFQTRFSMAIDNYSEMNTLSRQVMNRLELDVRGTSFVATAEPRKMVINVMDPNLGVSDLVGGSPAQTTITYEFDIIKGTLNRNGTPLVGNLVDCQFVYFNPLDGTTTSTSEIKKILLAATMRRAITAGDRGVTTSDYLVSSVVTMRCRNNK